jgi:conjugative relaxase-like TrwC/TraI family protein
MLSIGKLGQGQADYYLQAVGQGIEDYYTGAGEAPGRWIGSAAAELGIAGEVQGDALRAALNGHHPDTGIQLARPPHGAIRVPGFDLTFSAPKSVSVLFTLGDPTMASEVRDAHRAAVEAALGYMERHAAVARRGRGGSESVRGNGFVGAAFRHRTSRAGDPQLHTHVLVANMTRGPDGRWTSLDARRLYAHAKTGGYLYQAHLRAELAQRLGIEWAPIHRGAAEVAGIPRRVLTTFSRRRAEIEDQMSHRGDRSSRAAQVAALDTRQAKDYCVRPQSLIDRWRAEARAVEFDPHALRELVGRNRRHQRTRDDEDTVHDELGGPSGLTRQRSTFGRREVLRAWCEQLPDGAAVTEVERLADHFMASDRAVPLATDVRRLTGADTIRRTDGRVIAAFVDERPHSTPELLALERALMAGAVARRADAVGVVPAEQIEDALRLRPVLSDEQVDMVRRLTTDGAGVAIVIGKAGTGKTFALDAARDAWERHGYRVFGAALARRAARELQDGSGIQSTSVAALLQDLREGGDRGLLGSGRSVLVVDEAGMVGTRQLAEVLDHAAAARAKVVLVGDDHQLPEIDAGGAFRGLRYRLAPIRLTHNRRQENAWERDALDLLREGRASEAFACYDGRDRVVLAETASEAHGRLVDDWWAASRGGEEAVMVAARRDDVAALNARARALMAHDGRLGSTEIEVGGRRFAAGDHVVALSNARRFGVLNGTRGVVAHVDPAARELELDASDGVRLRLPAAYVDARTTRGGPTLDHGYAITGHKSQGMTTGRAFVLGTEELYREWGYVGLSRGRTENRLYLVAPAPPERDEYAPPEPPKDPLEGAIAALGRSRAQQMAVDVERLAQAQALPDARLRQALEQAERDVRAADLSSKRLEAQMERVKRKRLAVQARASKLALLAERDDQGPEHDQTEALVKQIRRLGEREEQLAGRVAESSSAHLSEPELTSWAAALDAEYQARTDLVVRTSIAHPPRYILESVGQRPERPTHRAAWYRAVRHIEAYRYRFGVTDPEWALGNEPTSDLSRLAAFRAARRSVDEVRDPVRRESEHALERGIA